MMVNPQFFLQMIKQGKNPEQLMLAFLQEQMGNTPMGNNLIQMAQNRDSRGIEQIARNYFKQQGKDYDKEFNSFRQMFGL
jgi:hypothetical protein